MVPKWSCGPSGDGKSEINEKEIALCVHASFSCTNSELGSFNYMTIRNAVLGKFTTLHFLFIVELTKCCIVHDRCYIDKQGLTKCDDDFCYCLKDPSKGSKCYEVSVDFCLVVKYIAGPIAYIVCFTTYI